LRSGLPDASAFLKGDWLSQSNPNSKVKESAGVTDTGSGYTIGNNKDKQGRPFILSEGAATAFEKIMNASNGHVKTTDVNSAQRSVAKNTAVNGASNSSHLYGNAIDVQTGSSSWNWMKQNNGSDGFYFNDYSPNSPWHWDYKGEGAGESVPPVGSESGVGGSIMRALSPAMQAFADFAMAFGGSALGGLSSLMGGGGDNTSVSGGVGPVDMGADINAKLMTTAKLAMAAGFTKAEAKTMAAIAGGESSFKNTAYNGKGADDSYGLWQINMLGAMGTERLKSLGLSSKADLYDPATNARAAKQIYDSQGFGAWGAYKDGGADKYMNAAQALKLQNGGIASMSGSGNGSRQMISKAQQAFAQEIAAASRPIVVPVPTGGGGGGGNPAGSSGASTPFPSLPSEDSSIVSMEYKYRITMGASV
jgi:hypothetical protein